MQLNDEAARSRAWIERQLHQLATQIGLQIEAVAWNHNPSEGTYYLVASVNGRRQVLPFTRTELGDFAQLGTGRWAVESRLLDLLSTV